MLKNYLLMADLQQWLHRLEQLQPDKIDLGLTRIKQVAKAAELDKPDFNIITVAGTNGKGSTVAFIDAILSNEDYQTGVFTSPHFIDFNERIVINGERVDDELLCKAFDHIEKARGDVTLTYFEFAALAAMYCFKEQFIDVAILEVGLGGRLDAVNAWDAEVACISSIAVDHVDWLGDDRESIGREKAGIARGGLELICGDPDPPSSIAETANEIGAYLVQRGIGFDVELIDADTWGYFDESLRVALPRPAIKGDWACDNAALAICAVGVYLGGAAEKDAIVKALTEVTMTGRMQMLDVNNTNVLLDVAHNPAAAEKLFQYLSKNPIDGATKAVFGCMQDKDISAILAELAPAFEHWYIADIDYPRAMSAGEIEQEVARHSKADCEIFTSVIHATEAAIAQSGSDDRVVVFGSFHVVGPAIEWIGA